MSKEEAQKFIGELKASNEHSATFGSMSVEDVMKLAKENKVDCSYEEIKLLINEERLGSAPDDM